MKKNVSLLKKIKIFNQFKRTISKNKSELESKFNIRIDAAKRMYTVLNIPPDLIGEAFTLRKADIDKISETYIKEYSTELAKYLDTKGLNELYDFYDIKKLPEAKYSYLLVFGFSQFKSNKYYNWIYYGVLPTTLLTIITLLIILL